MKKTRCKFKCDTVTEHGSGELSASFSAVTSGSDENKDFWKYTPSGSLTLQCLNPSVEFEPGKEYYIDIVLAQ